MSKCWVDEICAFVLFVLRLFSKNYFPNTALTKSMNLCSSSKCFFCKNLISKYRVDEICKSVRPKTYCQNIGLKKSVNNFSCSKIYCPSVELDCEARRAVMSQNFSFRTKTYCSNIKLTRSVNLFFSSKDLSKCRVDEICEFVF